MTKEVTPRFKGESTLWKCPKGNTKCTRKQPCPSCRGRRSRRSGLAKQRTGKKLVGVPSNRFRGQDGNEENWRDDVLRWEVKSGAQVSAIATKFSQAEAQSDGNKAIGDPRPFALLAMPQGWANEGLVVLRASVFRDLCDLARQAGVPFSGERPSP